MSKSIKVVWCVGWFWMLALVACPATTPGTEPGPDKRADAGQETHKHEPGKETTAREAPATDKGDASVPDPGSTDKTGQPEPTEPPPETTPELAQETTPEPSPEPSPPPKERWEPTTVLPDKRQETAVVAMGGEVYIIGGIDGQQTTVATLEAYDPKTKKWRKAADIPQTMHHANAIAYGGKLYVLGSLKPSFGADGSCFVYDPTSDKWTQLKDMPRAMTRGSSVLGVVGDKIYVVGGLRSFRSVTDMSVYDPKNDSWKALAPIPTDLDHLAGGAIGDVIVIAGGRHGGINSHIKATYVYDTKTDKWTKKSDMPTSRGGTAGAVYKGRLYIFGGEGNKSDPSGVFPQVESYELATDTWRKHTDMKTPRHGTNAATIGAKIYVPGGATKQAFGAVTTVEIYIPNH